MSRQSRKYSSINTYIGSQLSDSDEVECHKCIINSSKKSADEENIM